VKGPGLSPHHPKRKKKKKKFKDKLFHKQETIKMQTFTSMCKNLLLNSASECFLKTKQLQSVVLTL
jgi:hypothetical protein